MAAALLEVDGVTLRYAGERGLVTATERVSFSITEGERRPKTAQRRGKRGGGRSGHGKGPVGR